LFEAPEAPPLSSLFELFQAGQVIPEMEFDFLIGNYAGGNSNGGSPVSARLNHINAALHQAGVAGIDPNRPNDISGLMNGSIDHGLHP